MSTAAKFSWPVQDQKDDPKAEPPPGIEASTLAVAGNLPLALQPEVQPTDHGVAASQTVASSRCQSERLESVGRLAGGVAHDFNNLLTGVLLYCDLLLALESNERVRKYAQEIRNAGLQATGLVRQLLAVARPTNGDACLVSLNEVAEGMRNLLARLIGENIELQLRLDLNLGLVKMDPAQAQQILLNLVLNARDAMPGGGVITVETRNCQIQIVTSSVPSDPLSMPENLGMTKLPFLPCALFVVEDNGSGMDASTRSHIFEAFFTTKPTGKGTGLGLATVSDIVTSSGGLLHVESSLGRGTRVTVILPVTSGKDQASEHSGKSDLCRSSLVQSNLAKPEQAKPELVQPEKIEGEFPAVGIEKEKTL